MRALVALTTLAACEHGQTPPGDDVPQDAPTDCTPARLIEGALVDWDSTSARPAGVGASITQLGEPTVMAETSPDGQFSLCARPATPFSFLLEIPGDHLGGSLLIDPGVLASAFVPLELRTFTPARAEAFFVEQGLGFDPAAAQVVVFQAADRVTFTVSGEHDTPRQAEPDGAGVLVWSVGATGRYVLFPNVAPASSVQLGGDPRGPRPIPVAAGKLTLVATAFIFE